MTIDKIEIDGFGKLTSFSIELQKGFNFIYGDNESGKSTLCDFLLCMFYDLPNDGKKLDFAEAHRRKYKPWSGARFGGRVYFTKDGKQYLLEKTFGATKRSDRSKLLDPLTWEELGTGENIGEQLFGVGREGFLKTLYLSSFDAPGKANGNEEILNRLSNLETSGNEDVSYQKIKAVLEKQQHALLSKTGRGGEISMLKEQEAALKNEFFHAMQLFESLKENQEQAVSLKTQLTKVQQQITDTEQQYQTALAHRSYLSHQKTAQTRAVMEQSLAEGKVLLANLEKEYEDAQKTQSHVSEEDEQRAKKLEKQQIILEHQVSECNIHLEETIETQKQLQKKAKSRAFFVAITLFVVLVLAGVLLLQSNQTASVIAFVASFVVSGVSFFLLKGKNNANSCIQAEQQLAKTKETQTRVANEITALCNVYGAKNLQELFALWEQAKRKKETCRALATQIAKQRSDLASLEQSVSALPNDSQCDFSETVMQYSGAPAEVLVQTIAELKQKAQTMQERHYALSLQLAKADGETRTLSDVESELLTVTNRIVLLTEQHNALQKAGEWLSRAHEEIKSNFAPRLNQKVGEIFSQLTGEKYENVRLSDSFSMRYQNEHNEIVDAGYLSCGTYDLLYIALRLATISVLFETAPTLILDDAFLQLDDVRVSAASKFLQNNPAFSQVLYFSCHETASKLICTDNVNKIKLS